MYPHTRRNARASFLLFYFIFIFIFYFRAVGLPVPPSLLPSAVVERRMMRVCPIRGQWNSRWHLRTVAIGNTLYLEVVVFHDLPSLYAFSK